MPSTITVDSEALFKEIELVLDYALDEPWRIYNFMWYMMQQVADKSGSVVLRTMHPTLVENDTIIENGEVPFLAGRAILSAIGGIWSIITVLIALDILLLIGVFHGILRSIFMLVPNWWGARNKILGFIDIVFRFDTQYAHWVADHLTAAIIEFIQGLTFFIQLVAGTIKFVSGQPTHVPASHVPQAIINELNSVISRVSRIEHELHDAGHVAPSVPGTITAQLHSIHQQVGDLYTHVHQAEQSLEHLYTDHHITAGELHKLEDRVTKIAESLGSVRAVHVSAPDLLSQLSKEIVALDKWRPNVEAELERHASTLTLLAPLTMLLTGGLPGLRMLRTLEDEPCQCAEPSLPKPTISTGDDIWGLYEYFSEG